MDVVKLIYCGAVLAVSLTGCVYSPSADLPRPNSQAFNSNNLISTTEVISTTWWKVFNINELEPLMLKLENQNLSLSQAQKRIVRAQYLLTQAKAGDIPAITGRLSGRRVQDVDAGDSNHSSTGSIGATWDADIWGTRDAQQRSRQLGVDILQFQYADTLLDIQALFINTIIEQISLKAQLDIAIQNVEISKQLLSLVQIRFEEGDTSGIEVSQQRNTLINAESEVLRLTNSLTLNERALAVLLGDENMQSPSLNLSLADFAIPDLMPMLSADVLRRRPDVQLAIAQFKQADLTLYEASVAGLPGISLSADIGVSDLFELAKGWTLGAAISSAATLFDGGRLEAAEQAAKTDVDIAIVQYRQVVINAIEALLNSQTTRVYQQQNYRYALASLENNEQLYKLANIRYKAGDTDFLNLLNAQRSFFSARQSVINSHQAVLSSIIATYRASAGANIERS